MDKAAPKRGRGRPPTAPEHSLAHPISLRLPGALYALLQEEADERGETLGATARDILDDWFASRAKRKRAE